MASDTSQGDIEQMAVHVTEARSKLFTATHDLKQARATLEGAEHRAKVAKEGFDVVKKKFDEMLAIDDEA